MRMSKVFLDEKHYDLIVLKVECPYCGKARVYRSLDNNTFNATCKVCKEEFIVDHKFDDGDLVQKDYHVSYVGTRVKEYVGVLGIATSDIIHDKLTDEERIWVTYPDGKSFCFNIWDIKIERELNKENWKTYKG